MTYVVTLSRYTPLERDDTVAWTLAQIQEASDQTGTAATLIDTIVLYPVDPDPANPITRDLTTTKATLSQGWYRVLWVDGNSYTSSPTPWVQNLSALAGGVRPTVTEVASLLRARTKVRGGTEAKTFNTITRPTADEVEELIDDALSEVLGKVQPIDPTLVYGSAYNAPGSAYERRVRAAVKLYAALLVELSYWPEQVHSGQSPANTYQALFDSRIRALISEGETGRAEGMGVGGAGGGGDAPADAAWSFPTDTGGLVGWASRW